MSEMGRKVARSAQSGEFVSMEYAREHPDVTVIEEMDDDAIPQAAHDAGAVETPDEPVAGE